MVFSIDVRRGPSEVALESDRLGHSRPLSTDGTISSSGILQILDLSASRQPQVRFQIDTHSGVGVLFVDDGTIAVGLSDGLKLVKTDGTIQTLIDREGSFWAISPRDHKLVLAT